MHKSRATRSTTALLVLALAAGGLLGLPSRSALATAADFPDETWVTNGDVHAVTQVGGRIYLGGTFDQVGPNTGFGVPLDPATGNLSGAFPKVNGDVYAAASDGAGGWFIGGNFTRVGPVSRHNVARIMADGTVGGWNPNADFDVRAIAVNTARGIVYIGGEFTDVRGTVVTGLAATEMTAGYVTALPTAGGGNCAASPPEIRTCVQSLALSPDGNTLYVGGAFTSLGGVPRSHIAAVDTNTLTVVPTFDPGADGDVSAMGVGPGGRIYVGGSFSTFAGSGHANLVALTPAGAVDGLWGPSADGPVRAIAVSADGSRVYVGGDFADVGGTSRARLAALSTTQFGWLVDPGFDPGTDATVSALALDGNRLYAAGSFSRIGGRDDRRFLAALDAWNGNVDPGFDPRPGAATLAVATSGGRVYAGGLFTTVSGFRRANLAAIDAATGQLDMGFVADTSAQVNAIAADAAGGLFAGGNFMRVNAESRHKVARIDAATGAVDLAWNTRASAEVFSLAVSGSRLYIGGRFSSLTGIRNSETCASPPCTFPRNNVGRVSTVDGAVDATWNPNLDTAVYDMDFSPDQSLVYVAGSFNKVGTATRKNLAAIRADNGQATPWAPIVPMPTRKVSVSADGARVYVAVAGGDKDGNKLQGFNTGTGAMLWEHKGDGDFTGLDISGALVYAGGHFDNITDLGQPRQHLAAFDQITGAITPWGPSIAGVHGILDLEVHDTALLIAGEFRRVAGAVQQGWARFANSPDGPPPTTATTFPPGTTPPGPGPGPGPGGGGRSGYWMVGSDGKVYNFGDSAHHGNTPPLTGTEGVDLEPSPTGNGYWVVTSAGQVYGYGDARWIGNLDPAKVAKDERATSLSSTKTGNGYWIFTNKGRVLPFGDATHYGDMAATRLNGPVLDSIPTASGKGYYMVASDGGIFSFGDAKFYGSMGGKRLNAPVQSLVPDGDGVGYWLVASDGGIFAFDSPFKGSMGDKRLNKPVTGMVRFGNGYLMVAEDGGIFNFSDKQFFGSLGNNPPARPIVSVAALG